MKKLFKWLGMILLVLVFLALCGAGYLKFFLPDVGDAPDLKITTTPGMIERGKYLATSVTVCMDCHSTRDWSKFSGPITPGTEGKGGEVFDRTFGFPGVFISRNITPAGVGNWTDGELYRAITTGVNKNGEALFPVMPYHSYGELAKEDICAIISYVRTLKPIENKIPEREVDFPFSLILQTIPKKGNPGIIPQPSDSIAYGRYLVKAASCAECHTRFEKGQFVEGTEFGGGREFALPGGTLRTPNITADETGIGFWSRELFIAKFKQYSDSNYVSPTIDFMKEYNSIMPWTMYTNMTESDLSCIYQYLQTVTPIKNQVTKWTPKAVAMK